MRTTTVRITHLRSGQSRPHADTVSEAEIEMTTGAPGQAKPQPMSEQQAREIARLFVCHFEDQPKDPMHTRLESLMIVTPTTPASPTLALRWRVVIVQPFTD